MPSVAFSTGAAGFLCAVVFAPFVPFGRQLRFQCPAAGACRSRHFCWRFLGKMICWARCSGRRVFTLVVGDTCRARSAHESPPAFPNFFSSRKRLLQRGFANGSAERAAFSCHDFFDFGRLSCISIGAGEAATRLEATQLRSPSACRLPNYTTTRSGSQALVTARDRRRKVSAVLRTLGFSGQRGGEGWQAWLAWRRVRVGLDRAPDDSTTWAVRRSVSASFPYPFCKIQSFDASAQ